MWKLGEISLGREKLVSGRGSSEGRGRRQRQRLSTLFYAVKCQRQCAADVKFVVQVEVIVAVVAYLVVVSCLCCCCICCVSLVYDLIF